jgi:hypothetical protein
MAFLLRALTFEQQRFPSVPHKQIKWLADVIAARADLLQRLNEFVLVVIGSSSSAHFVLFDILVESVIR